MSPTEALARVEAIRSFAEDGDDEAAHAREDALHVDALAWIAHHGDDGSRELAKAALRTTAIVFGRWCG